MPSITGPSIISTKNAAGVVIVPANQALRFVGATVGVDGPAQSVITIDSGFGTWNKSGNLLTGPTPDAPVEFFGSTNNFDVPFRHNNIEVMRLTADGLKLFGTTSVGGGAAIQVSPESPGGILTREFISGAQSSSNFTRMRTTSTVSNATAVVQQGFTFSGINYQLIAKVIGRQTSGSAGAVGDSVSFRRTLVLNNIAGVVSILFQQSDFTYNPYGTTLITSVAGTNINFSVTGALNRDFSWGFHFEAVSIA